MFDAMWSGFWRIVSRYSFADRRLLFCGTARSVHQTGQHDRASAAADDAPEARA
jgi:hypothetical protein